VTGEPTPAPPARDRSLGYAIAASALLVVIAVLGAAGVSQLGRTPAPSPSPSFVRSGPASPAPTVPPSTDTGPLVFTQPLSAGCAAGDAIYVVSDGGGIGRFAFDRWQLIDPIARTLLATTCQGDVLTAVGGGGRIVTINDREQTIRSDTVLFNDFLGVAPLSDGVLAVGRAGTVQRQGSGGWGAYANGIDEDLLAAAAFGPSSAWAVGTGGASYRLETAGWRPVATGVTTALRAIAARAVDDAIVVGDEGVILGWSGRWTRLDGDAPAHVSWRAALRVGDVTYIAGDNGTFVRVTGRSASRPTFALISLGTTCTLRALFGRGDEVWVIGSDGGRAAVWRIAGGTIFHWGECP
jgi:hypothetical protein